MIKCELLKEKDQLSDDEILFMKNGTAIQEFLENSQAQLTDVGLNVLNNEIPEGRLCILFRNNHFSVLLKNNQKLFVLVTDIGYKDADQIV